MNTAMEVARYLLPILYAVAFGLYFVFFVRKNTSSRQALARLSTAVLLATVGYHFCYAVMIGIAYGHHPMASLYEVQSIVALALAGVYLLIETWRKNKSTGVFVLPFVLFIQIVSSVGIGPTEDIDPMLRQTPFGAHTGSLTIAYAAFFLSAVYGVMYMLFHRALQRKQFGLIFERFPSLDILSKMTRGAMLVGFIAMTIGLAVGIVWATEQVPAFWTDPKIAATLLAWAIIGFALVAHYVFKWSSRRVVVIALVGFGLIILSVVVLNIFFLGWHQFLR